MRSMGERDVREPIITLGANWEQERELFRVGEVVTVSATTGHHDRTAGGFRASGRFEIGLLTLHALAPAFEMHGGDYHLRLGDPNFEALPAALLPDLHATPGATVIVVPLTEGQLADDETLTWSAEWDDASLLSLKFNRVHGLTTNAQDPHLRHQIRRAE
jgi:hypothetical protein